MYLSFIVFKNLYWNEINNNDFIISKGLFEIMLKLCKTRFIHFVET